MKPGPALAALTLHSSIEIEAAPRDTFEWLSELIERQNWKGRFISSRECAEKWHPAFQLRLRNDLSELNRWGRYCAFAFNSSDDSLIQGAAFIEPSDSDAVKAEKKNRSRFKEYVEQLRSLTPRDLEKLCAGLLDLIGADAPQVTRFSADKGVDFYGQLRFQQHLSVGHFFPQWHLQLKTWLIGQAKHYVDGTVSTPALRDLVGTVTLLKGPLADRRAYPSLLIRSCDPVFMLLVTTGRLSRDVWDELSRSGAVGIDGETLASFLASRSVGCKEDQFVVDLFQKWLAAFDSGQLIPTDDNDDDDES